MRGSESCSVYMFTESFAGPFTKISFLNIILNKSEVINKRHATSSKEYFFMNRPFLTLSNMRNFAEVRVNSSMSLFELLKKLI